MCSAPEAHRRHFAGPGSACAADVSVVDEAFCAQASPIDGCFAETPRLECIEPAKTGGGAVSACRHEIAIHRFIENSQSAGRFVVCCREKLSVESPRVRIAFS